MKKIISFSAVMLLHSVLAQNVFSQDTVKVEKPDSVVIVKEGKNLEISVCGSKDNPDYRYHVTHASDVEVTIEKKKKEHDLSLPVFLPEKENRSRMYAVIKGSLLLGVNVPLGAPSEMSFSSKSYEIWLPSVLSFQYRPLNSKWQVHWDWGLDWRNYRIKDNQRFVKDEEGNVSLTTYPEGVSPKYSRIKVFSCTWALKLQYEFTSKNFISFGPVLSMNNSSSIMTRYSDEQGRKIKEKASDLKINRVTVDLFMAYRCHSLGFYVKYSPMNVFRKNSGPEFNNISLGVDFSY